jgi:hypothetical protein
VQVRLLAVGLCLRSKNDMCPTLYMECETRGVDASRDKHALMIDTKRYSQTKMLKEQMDSDETYVQTQNKAWLY